jgi:hypothetical protein
MKETFLQNIKSANIEAVKQNLNDPNFSKHYLEGIDLFELIKSSPEIAVLLISYGARIPSPQWLENIYDYAINNKLESVAEALFKRPNLYISNTLVENVIRSGNEKAINDLLARQDINLSFALSAALYSNPDNIELARKILGNPNFESYAKRVRIDDSLIKKSPEIALLLITKGGDISSSVGTLFLYAIDNKLDSVIEALLKQPNLDLQQRLEGDLGPSLLSRVIGSGNEKAINHLLARQDIDLEWVLRTAVYANNLELAQKIVSHSNFNESHAKKAYIVEFIKRYPEVASLLINKGADISVAIGEGHLRPTPLLAYAINHKLESVVEALLKRPDLDINAAVDNQPLLVYAMNANNNALVERVLTSDNFIPNNTLNVVALLWR